MHRGSLDKGGVGSTWEATAEWREIEIGKKVILTFCKVPYQNAQFTRGVPSEVYHLSCSLSLISIIEVVMAEEKVSKKRKGRKITYSYIQILIFNRFSSGC